MIYTVFAEKDDLTFIMESPFMHIMKIATRIIPSLTFYAALLAITGQLQRKAMLQELSSGMEMLIFPS